MVDCWKTSEMHKASLFCLYKVLFAKLHVYCNGVCALDLYLFVILSSICDRLNNLLLVILGRTKDIPKEEELIGLQSATDSPQPSDPLIERRNLTRRSVVHTNGLDAEITDHIWRRAHSVKFQPCTSSSGQVCKVDC